GRLEIPLSREDDLVRAIEATIDEHLSSTDELVIGLPLNMDGTEGPRAKLVRAFAERLQRDTGRRVHLQDERRSTMAADQAMAQSGLTHGQKKARRDAIAAMVILRTFLESHRDDP
ncbi:MAG: Holliday junction resolvase RuvX, partial [Phycisphaerales bacterium]|nr:Holliday junction resolvase RuvX [Phycisphaerales bacterium]